ncbi:MAG: hypothetical protein NTZ05_00480, partial [Chloroflexi bacterium]|nr:hypothetical protein [Chloroflexota bacterium]
MRPLRAVQTATRSEWALPAALALAASSVIAVNTLLLPVAAPDLAWGPQRSTPTTFTVSNRSPNLERQMRNFVQNEVRSQLNRPDGFPDPDRMAA